MPEGEREGTLTTFNINHLQGVDNSASISKYQLGDLFRVNLRITSAVTPNLDHPSYKYLSAAERAAEVVNFGCTS